MSEQVNHLSSVITAPSTASTPSVLSEKVRSLSLHDHMLVPPTPRASKLPWLMVVVLAFLCGFLAMRDTASNATSPTVNKDERLPGSTAEIKTASLPSGKVALEAGGYVIPVRRVQVSPKVGGEVVELLIEEGQEVKKGQVLARLDRTKYEFEYRRTSALADQAKAELDKMKTGNREEEKKQAAAALREAEELCSQLRDEYNRLHRSSLAASAEELVRITSRLRQNEFKVEQLRQTLKVMNDGFRKEDIAKAEAAYHHAVAQRDNVKYDLDCTEIVAPISGRILVKKAEVGNTVRPEAFSNGLSASLCEMADIKDLEVDVDVSERDLDSVFKGQRCEIYTEAFPDKIYSGFVSRLMPEANRSKASVSVRVHIDVSENETLMRPEMRARVRFLPKDGNGANSAKSVAVTK